MKTLRVLNRNGDDETNWTAEDQKAAEKVFNEQIAQRYTAIALTGGESRRIDTFDPAADEIVMFRQLIGG